MQKELRRRLDTITILGTGICFFGIWGVIKIVMQAIANRNEFNDIVAGNNRILYVLVVFAILAIILLLALAPHLYIGLSARGEGRRGKKHTAYLFVTGFMAALYIVSIVFSIVGLPSSDEPEDVITSIILDLTVSVTLIQIIINSIKIKKLRKLINEGEGS